MKKSHLIALLAVIAAFIIIAVTVFSPFIMLMFGSLVGLTTGVNAEVNIDSYRICQDDEGNDIIIIKYLLINDGKEPTCLCYEADCYVYQNGVSLSEYYGDETELPKECNYDSEDQYRNVKGGVSYYAEIAYILEYPDADVEVEVNDYGWFDRKKERTFKIK